MEAPGEATPNWERQGACYLGGRASSPAIFLAANVAFAIGEMAGGDARPPRAPRSSGFRVQRAESKSRTFVQ